MAASNSVLIKQVFLVTPAKPTPPHVLKLSALDSLLMLRLTGDYLFIYSPPSGSDPSSISSNFRAALAEVLVMYYPLSGRVRESPDGSGLEVVCRSQGVFFVEAATNCYSAADFDRPPPPTGEWRGFMSFYLKNVLDGPPLVVQLTWLKDGAAVVGVGISHSMCDGTGSAEFLNSFAKLAATRLDPAVELKPMPVWDRHLLTPQPHLCHRRIPVPLPGFNGVPDLCRFASRFTDEPLVPTSMTFGKTHSTSLKSLAHSMQSPGETKFTTFEVLTAHIWKSWAKSLKLPPNQILKLLFSINVRKLVKPNLPAGYYGNAIVLGCAKATAGELADKNLGHAAGLVQRVKQRIGDEHVTEFASDLRATPDLVGALIVTQWSRLGLQNVDFGMGRPVHVGPIFINQHCYLLPVCNETDAVKAMMAVPTSAVDDFESLIRNMAT